MKLVRPLINYRMRQRINRIQFFLDNPLDTQELVFNDLIQTAANTIWGSFFDYNSIKSFEDYRKKVPLQDYESLKPYINRMIKGERDVLWPGKTKWFG
jgi:hypothetical protein